MSSAEWVDTWKVTGPVLAKIQIDEHRAANLETTLLTLSDVNEYAIESHKPVPYSGIIEMQRLFAILRKNETGS